MTPIHVNIKYGWAKNSYTHGPKLQLISRDYLRQPNRNNDVDTDMERKKGDIFFARRQQQTCQGFCSNFPFEDQGNKKYGNCGSMRAATITGDLCDVCCRKKGNDTKLSGCFIQRAASTTIKVLVFCSIHCQPLLSEICQKRVQKSLIKNYRNYLLPPRQIKYPVDIDVELKIGDVRYENMT